MTDQAGPAGGNARTRPTAGPRATPEQVVFGIFKHMRARGLLPGDELPSEQTLIATFGVSRTVVRTALTALAALRMAEIANGRRARVTPLDADVMALMLSHAVDTAGVATMDFLEARRGLETRAAALAATRRDDSEAARLRELAAGMVDLLSLPRALMEQDVEFHAALMAACRSPLLVMLARAGAGANALCWSQAWSGSPREVDRHAMADAHMAIAAAVTHRDPRAAEAAMGRHFDLFADALAVAARP